MKTLKIMGYIFAVLITVIIIAVWLLIFPYSLEEIEIVGFKYIVPFLFKIFLFMSFVPFIFGAIGAIFSVLKHEKGLVHYIIILAMPSIISVLFLLTKNLI